MKTTNYLWIAPLVGLITLAGCSTSSTSHNPPPDYAKAGEQTTGGQDVTLSKKAPTAVGVGEQFTYELTATAQSGPTDVTVTDVVPEGATYVGSQPEAAQEGNKLSWKFPSMSRGESRTIAVTVKAEKEGQLMHCATAYALPQVCITTIVGKPQLVLKKSGPATAQMGEAVNYEIVVQNTGNVAARDVVVTDTLPDGLSSSSNQKELSFQVGELAPGTSKSIPVALKATKRGKFTNKAAAVASNGGKANAEVVTAIAQPNIKLHLATKDTELFINRPALYNIEVANTGDTSLTGVMLTDTASPETPIATAEGASVNGSTASWAVGTLAPGEKKQYALKIVSKVPGKFVDMASVTSAEGPKDSAQEATTWKGVTGVTLEYNDDTDPIQVNETSKFTIRVTNQGSAIDVSDLTITATLPAELELVPNTVSDGGTVADKNITWSVSRITPKTSVVRTYIVKAVKAGDARSAVSINSGALMKPMDQHESTTVY